MGVVAVLIGLILLLFNVLALFVMLRDIKRMIACNKKGFMIIFDFLKNRVNKLVMYDLYKTYMIIS